MFGTVHEIGYSKDHLALVGAIAIEWASIEFKLQMLLASVVGKDVGLGLSATSNMGYKSIVDSLRTLAGSATASIPTFHPQLLALLEEADRLQLHRNAIVHGVWEAAEPGGGMSAQVVRFKGKLKNHTQVWAKGQLEQIAADCGELLAAFYEFMSLHDFQDEIEAYVVHQASLGTRTTRLNAEIQPRSPKSEAVMRQLLASRR